MRRARSGSSHNLKGMVGKVFVKPTMYVSCTLKRNIQWVTESSGQEGEFVVDPPRSVGVAQQVLDLLQGRYKIQDYHRVTLVGNKNGDIRLQGLWVPTTDGEGTQTPRRRKTSGMEFLSAEI